MIIERSIAPYLVFTSDSILAALQKISQNKAGFVVTVSEQGHLVGVVTDGDVRRWLTHADIIDVNDLVSKVHTSNSVSMSADSSREDIAGKFTSKIRYIPLVDAYSRVVAIAFQGKGHMTIGERAVGKEYPSYIIAEIGNNHNGSEELGRHLIDLAVAAGADCAKFQMRDLNSLYGQASSGNDQDLGAEYTLDLLSRFNLGRDALFRLFDYCKACGVEPLCTPWDIPSLIALEEYGLSGYKVASADLTNNELLTRLAATGKPLICSTGMSREAEIKGSVALLRGLGAQFALLHCNSTYPTPYKDINLKYMDRLAEIGDCPIGYSGHERGWTVPVAAVARGANIIEKHFTIDRSMEGNDHRVSLLPDEFKAMVEAIRSLEESMGGAEERVMTQGEMMNREVLAKSLYAGRSIVKGEIILDEFVTVRSPGQGLQPNRRNDLIGKIAKRDIKAGTPFFPSDIEADMVRARDFAFARPWGIPVRWHDYRSILEASNPDLLEYHLSYKDMDVDLSEIFSEPLDIDYVVHAPELFKGDHILDLASEDEAYWERSIVELQRVVDLTRDLRKWHKHAKVPCIVTNMGGFSTAQALPVSQRKIMYERVANALRRIDSSGVDIIAQTMPPFPWHFGGQSYHNLFIDPDEILDFCKAYDARICLDISHSQLACNQYHWSMKEFVEKVAPYTAHLHIVDAVGVDGEGLQIGQGMVDFAMIADTLNNAASKASFIPEVWQGHKDSGAGFWYALDQLEKWFGDSKLAHVV